VELTELAISGPLLLAAAVAVVAGAVSFASPCSLPLVPGYLAYLAGLVGSQPPAVTGPRAARTGPRPAGTGARPAGTGSGPAGDGAQPAGATPNPARRSPAATGRWRVAGAASLFVLGFTAVFMAAMLAVLGLADALLLNERLLQRAGGVLTIVMGLAFLGLVPPLQRSVKLAAKPRDGLWGAPVLGMVYGLGWTPCLGPTLAGVIAVASATDVGPTTGRGIALIIAYCLGLGLPFVVLALGASWAIRTTGWLRRHTRRVQQFGGALLLVIGIMLVTGLWAEVIAALNPPLTTFAPPI
jgi:cytochrome c-type biogenesis protein